MFDRLIKDIILYGGVEMKGVGVVAGIIWERFKGCFNYFKNVIEIIEL